MRLCFSLQPLFIPIPSLKLRKWYHTQIHTLYEVMQTRSVENNRQRFAVSRLTVRAVKKIVFSPDERKQQVGDKQDLGRRNHESYCEVEVGVSAAGIDPEVP